MKWWSPAGNAPAWHCLQGRRFTFQPRPHGEIGTPPWCCPKQTEFWRLGRALALGVKYMVRLPGVALGWWPSARTSLAKSHSAVKSQPQENDWRGARKIALDPPKKVKGPERLCVPAPAISIKNKHLLLSHRDTNPRIHGGCFGV